MATKTPTKSVPKKAATPAKRAPRKGTPKEPERSTEITMELSARLLANVLRNAMAAASKDNLRPVLCAAMVQSEDGFVRVVSTDSYRLLVQEFPIEGAKPSAPFVVERESLMLIERLARSVKQPRGRNRFTKPAQPASLSLAPGKVTFAVNGTSVESKLKIDSPYPGWDKLVEGVPPKLEIGVEGKSCVVNGGFLADLAKLSPLIDQLPTFVIQPQNDPLKPLQVEVCNRDGYRVYALLMPVRT